MNNNNNNNNKLPGRENPVEFCDGTMMKEGFFFDNGNYNWIWLIIAIIIIVCIYRKK